MVRTCVLLVRVKRGETWVAQRREGFVLDKGVMDIRVKGLLLF